MIAPTGLHRDRLTLELQSGPGIVLQVRASLVVLFVLAACSKAAPPAETKSSLEPAPALAPAPTPTVLWHGGAPIALRWITDRPAWHTAQPVDWIVPVGDRVIVASDRGWIASFDGATGTFSHERTFDVVYGVVDLGNGRVLVLVAGDVAVVATVLDATTLATLVEKPLPTNNSDSTSIPSVARVPNGPLVIALPGEPLVLYDPTTFKRTRTLAKGTEWTNVMATATAVYASRPNPDYSEFDNKYSRDPRDPTLPTVDARILLKTGALDEGGRLPHAVGPDMTYQPQAKMGLGWYGAAVFREASDTPLTLADDIGVTPEGKASAFSANGETIAVEDRGEVKLYSTVTGKLGEKYPIAAANLFDERKHPFRVIAFAGSTLYVAYEQEIRVIDLAKHTVSPVPAPPSTSMTGVLVSNSGDVQTIDRVVGRFTNGKRTTTYSFRGDAMLLATSTLGIYGGWEFSNKPDTPSKLITYRDGKQIKEWPLAEFIDHAWITTSGTGVVWASTARDKQKLVEQIDGVVYVRTQSSYSTFDIDGDAQLAITDGRLLDLKTGVADTKVLDGPCKYHSHYRLEPQGTRVVAWYGDSALLWDRTTKKQLVSLRLPRYLQTDDAPLEIRFLRGTSDLVIRGDAGLALWSPATNELRTITGTDMQLATSPDGQSLGIVIADGRVGLAAYGTFRAAIKPEPARPAGAANCPSDLLGP